MRVLVLSSEPSLCTLLCAAVRGEGREIAPLGDLAEAALALGEAHYPLIIAGLESAAAPAGPELVRRLSGLVGPAASVVVAVVHEGSAEEARDLLAHGADDCVLLSDDFGHLVLRLDIAARRAVVPPSVSGRVAQRLRLTQFSVDRAAEPIFWIGPDARFEYANEAACRSLGYSLDEVLGLSVFDVSAALDGETWKDHWRRVRERGSVVIDTWHRRRDGETFPVEVTVNFVEFEGAEHHVAVARDVTERKRAEAELLHGATHDPLTGLPNRKLFMERLREALDRSRAPRGGLFAVLFLDFDRFKVVNDSLGHAAGDELLVEMADRLRASVRPPDTVARVGGDEFLILLTEVGGAAAAVGTAERILATLCVPLTLAGRQVVSGASVGIALPSPRGLSAEDILRDADTALYRAKADGGGAAVVFDGSMHAEILARLDFETDLRGALDRGEIGLVYQPMIRLAAAETQGFEAAPRWNHPRLGPLAAADFLPMAEEIGVSVPLFWALLDGVCAQIGAWQDELGDVSGLSVALDLAGRPALHAELEERIAGSLRRHRVPPESLSIEVALTQPGGEAVVRQLLQRLRRLGVSTSLDAFGVGRAAVCELARLPVDRVKLAPGLVSGVDRNARARTVVRSVVALIHELEMGTVALGLESPRQRSQFRELGCDGAQGPLFAGFLDPQAARAWLVGHPLAIAGPRSR